MSLYRATVKTHNKSGMPEDDTVNVWHFIDTVPGSPDPAGTDVIASTLHAQFYDPLSVWASPTVPLSLSATIDIAQVDPGGAGAGDDTVGPVLSSTDVDWADARLNASPLPSEVASCLSFSGLADGIPEDDGGIRPASRRRGRVFLGPFSLALMNVTANGRAYVGPSYRTAALDAYENIGTTLAAYDYTHVVYSRTTGLSWVVDRVWIDDAFDTIRSRGEAPTERSSRTI